MISVVIPVYNSEKYLQNCLNSILHQTYSDLEIICIDDGSTDNSVALLEDYCRRDTRIRVLLQENAGASAARNRGIDAASGEYITFVDSDDAISMDMYQTLISILENDEVDIAHCGYRRHNKDGSTKDVSGTGEYLIQDPLDAAYCLIAGKKYVGSLWNKLYRRKLFDGIRLDPDLRINEDVLANVQLFLRARKSVFLDKPFYQYYDRSGSTTSATDLILSARDCVTVAERIVELTGGTKVAGDASRRLRNSLISEYRVLLLRGGEEAKPQLPDLQSRINAVISECGAMSFKQEFNYHSMIFAPRLYKTVYPLYNRIRKPNWDIG